MNIYLSLFTKVKRGFISFYKHFNPSLEKNNNNTPTNCKNKLFKYVIMSVKLYQIKKCSKGSGLFHGFDITDSFEQKKIYQRYDS